MKNLLILLSIFFIVPSLFSQNISINNSGADPHESAILDVSSTSKGVLIPRMTKMQRDAISALTDATGLMIYQTDQSPGFYVYNGSSWDPVGANVLAINDLMDGISDGSSVFLGENAGINDDGNNTNVGVGIEALISNTSGSYNTAVGYQSLFNNTTGWYNNALGRQSLQGNTTGSDNVAIGKEALRISNGDKNIGLGTQTMNFTASGSENVGIGYHSLRSAAGFGNFSNNTGVGTYVMEGIREGQNTAIGSDAMRSSTYATQNVAVGYETNKYNTTGDYNTMLGYQAGRGTTATYSASGNVLIGYQAGYNETGSNKLYIENSNSSTPLIGGDFNVDELYLNGKVGINTMSPLTKLQVDGNITFAPAGISTDESRFIGQSIFSQSTFEASNGFGGMEVENFDRPGDDDSAQQLHFWTHHQGVESARRMTIDTVGFVGVGTEDPDNILEVARDGAVSNIISTTYRPGGFTGGGFVGRGARGSKEFPSALQNGDFMGSFNARGYGSTGFSPLPRGRLAFIAAQDWTDTEQGSHLIMETVPLNGSSDQERMRITSQGNVGIGTINLPNPQHKLHIVQDSTQGNALMVTQNTNENAATIDIPNPGSTGHALNVYNSGSGYGLDLVIHPTGTGPGGRFTIDNSSNTQPAIYGEHNGTGNVGQFHANYGGNTQAAIFAQTQGIGPAGDFRVNNVSNTGVGINVLHKGQGPAGFFRNDNATNTVETLIARNDGMGKAGSFHAYNFSNTSTALYTESTGMASALGVDNNGDGKAGYFNINGTTNDNNVIEVKTLGTGSAALLKIDNTLNSDAVVVIEGNGSGPSIVADGTVDVAGFKMPTSPASGHVLTSDASGVGTWQAPAFDFSEGGENGGADRSLGNTDNYSLSFLTNNTDRVKIFNDGGIRLDGNLGIFTDPNASGSHKAIDLYDSELYSNPYLKISGHNSGYIDLTSRRVGSSTGRSYKIGSGGGSTSDLDKFYIQSSVDGYVLAIRDGGNVGIGTLEPDEKLHVAGNIRLDGSLEDKDGEAGTSSQILSSTGSGTDWILSSSIVDYKDGGENGGADRTLGNQDNFDIGLITNNLNRLHIQNDGKIGIGTTDPADLLELKGGSDGEFFGISINQQTDDLGYPSLFFKDNGNNLLASIFPHQTRTHLYFRLTSGDFIFDRPGGGTPQFTIKSSGNVGVGTTSPDEKFHVAGNARIDGSLEDKDGDAGISGQLLSSTGTGTDWISSSTIVDYKDGGESGGADRTLGNTDNFALGLMTNNTQRIKIENDGKIGMGTTGPKGDLHINNHLLMDRTSTDKDYMIGNNIYNDGGWKYIDNGYGSILTFSNNGSVGISTFFTGTTGNTAIIRNKFYLENSGNLGLSNTSPSSMLDINANLGYNQLRLRTSYTPTGTSDPNGNVGDTAWDDDYFYIKTSTGWKRAALSTW